ncbi:MAG: DinB family protein [Caldilineaceae bacterium]
MNAIKPGRPGSNEHLPYFSQYIDLVPDGDIVELLISQLQTTCQHLSPLSPEQVNFRPKPEDWNILEIIGHLADTERVFAYRALRIARNDSTPLPSFDQDLFVANANFANRPLADLLDEFATVRRATIAFFRTLDHEAWLRIGTASNHPISVRALAYGIAGHELHHVADFRQRYRV